MKMQRMLVGLSILLVATAGCGGTAAEPPAVTALPAQPTASTTPTATTVPSPTPASSATATSVPPSPTPRAAADPGALPGGLIAFYSDREGNAEIYTIHADGSGLARLTDDPGWDDSPALSPDGRQIAFLTARHDPRPRFPNLKYELYVMDVDGGNLRRLTETDAAEDHPAWSPDSTRILFDADYDGDGYYEIYSVAADGSDLQRLTSSQANDQFADWSPDGTQIAFASDRDGNWDLYVMDASGSNPRPLTTGPDWELFPAWSPDGTQIAFNGLQPSSRNTDVYVMNADGSDVRQLTDTPRFDENPAWSPDDTSIAFQTQRDGDFELYVMDADGANPRPLAAHRGGDLWPSWGPLPAGGGTGPVFEPSAQAFDDRGTFQAGLGDLDGDGDLDAVFANPQTHSSEVWLNDGRGTLVDTGQQLTQYGHGVAMADFDGDGDLDAFIACHQFVTPSKVYLNDGMGRFEDTGQDLGDAQISATEVNVLDLDGDGHLDVHVQYYDPQGLPDRVYRNDGRARFTDSGLALEEETIAWGDLDGDGDVDYFGKRWGQGYVVQLNDGQGRFTPGWRLDDEQATVGGMALADFDEDGDLDAMVSNGHRSMGSSATLLFWNDGSGQFSDSGQRLNETLGAELAVGDLDGDGDLEVFVANMDLPDEVWINGGGSQGGVLGSFGDSGLRLGDVPPKGHSTKASLGDLDGDVDLEVFVGSLASAPRIWLNQSEPGE